jgi:exopolyphosphatase/guanosine-5'-triphosphate,3'-diphosphate pyrophosphatase
MVGSGGTFTNLAGMLKTEREDPGERSDTNLQGYAMRRAEVVNLLQRLRAMPLEMRRTVPGLNPQRADIIVAGAAAVARLARRLGTQRIVVNPGGLRSGLLLAMIAERATPGTSAPERPKDRFESVRVFARKCHSSERHCEHVATLAGQLFDGLRGPHALPGEGREILQAAALLHDVGYLINHAKHHKHAYHLIQHAELTGWTAREVELIANVARYHRKAAPKKRHPNFRRLDRPERRLVRALAAMLRVADGLDRTHTQRVSAVGVEAGRTMTRLVLAAATDPQVERWEAERRAGLFNRVFDTTPDIVWNGAAAATRRVVRKRSPRLRLAVG